MYKYIANEFNNFFAFLLERNIFQTGVAFIIASQVNKLMLDFINNLVSPVLSKTVNGKIENKTVKLFGIEFKIGLFLVSLTNFFVIMLLIYYLYKLSNSGGSVIKMFTTKIKNLFN